MKKRVVVTGLGVTSPFGFGLETLWNAVIHNKNGIRKITDVDVRGELVQIAAPLPKIQYKSTELKDLNGIIPEDDNVLSFFKAVQEARENSGLDFLSMSSTKRVGVFIADRSMAPGIYVDQTGPLIKQCGDSKNFSRKNFFKLLIESHMDKKTPYNDPDSINHITSRAYQINGPQLSIGTACASGNNAIGEGYFKIKQGNLDIVIAGGAFNYDITGMIGFTRIGALTLNPDPETACCPFDFNRSGFVMGSGCGILILEELEHALKRNANIVAEITGYASYADAYRATDPDPEASGATRTIAAALNDAKLNPEDIDYINAHGTSTKMNDLSETVAIKNVFKDYAYKVPVSSTKSMIGHGIMAAGAIEGVISVKSIMHGIIHPTRNWQKRDIGLDLDYVPHESRDLHVNTVLSNNFGFGGQNASVIFTKYRG